MASIDLYNKHKRLPSICFGWEAFFNDTKRIIVGT